MQRVYNRCEAAASKNHCSTSSHGTQHPAVIAICELIILLHKKIEQTTFNCACFFLELLRSIEVGKKCIVTIIEDVSNS